MLDGDIILSSDEDLPVVKKKNVTSNIFTKETLLQHSKMLITSVKLQEIKYNECKFFNLIKQESNISIYCRINEILCIDTKDIKCQQINIIGLYIRTKIRKYCLKYIKYDTKIELIFVDDCLFPRNESYVHIFGKLNTTNDDKPLISVISWRYLTEHLVKSLDRCLYNSRIFNYDKKIKGKCKKELINDTNCVNDVLIKNICCDEGSSKEKDQNKSFDLFTADEADFLARYF